MRVAVTGASGLIGAALVPALRAAGHDVVRLVRRAPRAPDEVRWDPAAGTIDTAGLAGVTAAVHLAGAGVGDHRWTAAYKREIRDSRVRGTDTLSRALAELSPRPAVLLSGSAIGWYPDVADRAVTEEDQPGTGFISAVAQAWEAATAPAEEAGIRVVHMRTGLVVAARGGAWGRMFPIFRAGIGGRLGSGRQYWSFISLPDEIRAIDFLLGADEMSGPVNLTAPNPATNAEVTRAMGRVLHRPTIFPAPAAALRLVLGEFSSEVLSSHRVLPQRLLAAGFSFRHPDIEAAVRAARAG